MLLCASVDLAISAHGSLDRCCSSLGHARIGYAYNDFRGHFWRWSIISPCTLGHYWCTAVPIIIFLADFVRCSPFMSAFLKFIGIATIFNDDTVIYHSGVIPESCQKNAQSKIPLCLWPDYISWVLLVDCLLMFILPTTWCLWGLILISILWHTVPYCDLVNFIDHVI